MGNGSPTIDDFMNSSISSGKTIIGCKELELKPWMALWYFLGQSFPYPQGNPGSMYDADGLGRITLL
jgi:hypothetical protein